MSKRFVFQNYWWIAFIVAVAAVAVVVKSGATDRGSLIATTLGTALTFCYFVQKQKLDELKLFNELFTIFNRRYDTMNAKLEDIRAGKQMSDAELKKTLVDYFNLCAEEYLFLEEGYIHPKVWQSWCRGMLYYVRTDRIRSVWDAEMITEVLRSAVSEPMRRHQTNGGLPHWCVDRQKSGTTTKGRGAIARAPQVLYSIFFELRSAGRASRPSPHEL